MKQFLIKFKDRIKGSLLLLMLVFSLGVSYSVESQAGWFSSKKSAKEAKKEKSKKEREKKYREKKKRRQKALKEREKKFKKEKKEREKKERKDREKKTWEKVDKDKQHYDGKTTGIGKVVGSVAGGAAGKVVGAKLGGPTGSKIGEKAGGYLGAKAGDKAEKNGNEHAHKKYNERKPGSTSWRSIDD